MGELSINWPAAVLLGTVADECVMNTHTERSTDTAKLNARVTFRKGRRKSNFAQVGTDYTWTCIYKTVQLISKLLTPWKMIGRSVTAPQPVLSPSSILPSTPSHCAFIAEIKTRRAFRKCYFLFITENLRASGSVRTSEPHFITINAGISN